MKKRSGGERLKTQRVRDNGGETKSRRRRMRVWGFEGNGE